LLESVIVEKCGCQIGLWIEIRNQNTQAEVMEHPRQMIGERRLANATLVVEKGDAFHKRLNKTTRK
jgi:hypothetical protein